MAGTFIIMGILNLLMPVAIALREGVDIENTSGFQEWLISQPFSRIMLIRAMMMSGMAMIPTGIALALLP